MSKQCWSELAGLDRRSDRSKTNMALWMTVAIILVPLIPYALDGTGG
ncbi:hypothetical protein [Candidatus Thiodictyon syntrophicum]|jgi:hypothetical protein|nr:hypothetical protein [Candidatus Thiodictyon syntrophicum]